ncbi:hypothetical protein AM493_13605 [Flavobacterium akiainvivens]|uniref:ATPase n=1 Tax=Flavobacterium akiainvivens TaxID=1202724 RepID=A0A0M9VIR5_9FLAO|nr:SRPBCC domain-containing protein [Flavobacterium akiainvivens]KOS06952.1 hypothetical protein AM493_13605 [Flavobacterium akiainvivens]SFQ60113.1 hypothetical protein SAMN05444144_109159 [Flavobacterium akiainvivens]
MNNYYALIETPKPSGELYTAINNVAGWWTENMEGNTQNVGDAFTVTFGETHMKLKVEALVPNQKVIWRVTDSHKHFVTRHNEWNGTQIVFEITGGTITFNHFGLEPQLECYEICEGGWNHYLASLKLLIETGTGNADKKV